MKLVVGKPPLKRKISDASNFTCQKCLKKGHFTYECTGQRKYVSRPTRTSVLKKKSKLEEHAKQVSTGESKSKSDDSESSSSDSSDSESDSSSSSDSSDSSSSSHSSSSDSESDSSSSSSDSSNSSSS